MHINPINALIPNLDQIVHPESFFGNIKHDFIQFQKDGYFNQDGSNAIYLYHIKTAYGSHRGFIAGNDIKDLKNEKILRHECTLAAKETKIMELYEKDMAMVKPVLLAYKSVRKLESLFDAYQKNNDPFIKVFFYDWNESHRIWKISEPKILDKIKSISAKKIPKVYIADGHHRIAGVSKLYDEIDPHMENHNFLAAYFPFAQLTNNNFNRVVDISEIMDGQSLLKQLEKYVEIKIVTNTKGKRPQKKHELTMYLDQQWYRLRWNIKVRKKEKGKNPIIDTALLNKYILGKILKIKDVRDNDSVEYISGKLGYASVEDAVDEHSNKVGFQLYPIAKKTIRKMADQGLTLPPKSTWFEPRIKNGLIVMPFSK